MCVFPNILLSPSREAVPIRSSAAAGASHGHATLSLRGRMRQLPGIVATNGLEALILAPVDDAPCKSIFRSQTCRSMSF
jgi:hypothetical protein